MANIEDVKIVSIKGPKARGYFQELASLRIQLFSEYPYLYEGNKQFEEKYIETYFASMLSTFLIVFHEEEVVGYSTLIPLSEESDELKKPFLQNNLPINDYLYIGELLLTPPFRGKGLLRVFLDHHEKMARELNYQKLVFMTVERNQDDPLRPLSYQPYDPIWERFGFKKIENLAVQLAWKQVNTLAPVLNSLSLWEKSITPPPK